ncbi:hypothetical protein COT75_02435 [Candidatus Beckwithbacteria bacterium CG10_big_fil_rev_8_21_14_0_10_34_10]|uniref:Methyltransferase domain-containing protein n=1 Tax=Candidatus Beckwithbacteria bacterium CG10_big_fil_rev_8_21_14_0_10_34_10 TaxID=1974495 RepID=A0A2H0W9C4_9BACT|nr:MAG: hypothetical protein COT75_02435 [Candidatus Beckwithbacteria bacterium CG10_big_fil_rev_8_21_14_0_10_34_10]
MAKVLSYLSPQKIESVSSSYNGLIEVIEIFGEKRVLVNSMIQSGGMLEPLWQKALKKVHQLGLNPKKVLILGLGGGTLVKLLNKGFKGLEIVGVEIDPQMIRIGKKYFHLDENKNLKIVKADAIKYVLKKGKLQEKFDLILNDLYLGNQIPPGSESKMFLHNLKKMVSLGGLVVFNRLFYKEHRLKAEKFVKILNKYFKKILLLRAWSNLLVLSFR